LRRRYQDIIDNYAKGMLIELVEHCSLRPF
jgi:hypothetical protein